MVLIGDSIVHGGCESAAFQPTRIEQGTPA
jgi:hypothetical protein